MAARHHAAGRSARLSRRRWAGALVLALLLAALVAAAWLWVLPYFIERRLVDTFAAMTGREVSIARVAVNPLNAELTLEGFRIAGESRTPVLSSERIEAVFAWRSLWSSGWYLESLAFQAPQLQLIWREDGQWNLVHLFAGGGQGHRPAPIRIRRIHVRDGRLDWINRRLADPVTLSFEQVRLDARDYDNTSDAPSPVQSQAVLDGAALTAEGAMGLSPWSLDVDLTGEGLPLTALSPYLGHVVRARVNAGTLAAQVRMQSGRATDAGLRISGDGQLRDGAMLAPDADRAIARVGRLMVEGMLFELDRPRLAADRITLQAPWTEVVINSQKGTNLTAWLPPEQATPGASATAEASPAMRYAVQELVVEKGAMAFADRHLSQPFEVDFSDLQGQWHALSSSRDGGGTLSLNGRVSDGSPLRIEGNYDPLRDPWRGEFDLHFARLRLATFAPYVRQFGGYAIEQGQVTLDLDYRLEHGRLDTQNSLVLRRVQLGEQVDDAATDLPLKMLVGVLRNDDGTIELDIPVTLPLDDLSDVDVGAIAGQAFRKALENLVSSPIETLGEVAEGGGETGGDPSDESGTERSAGGDSGEREESDSGVYDRLRTPR